MPPLWSEQDGVIGFIDDKRLLLSVRELPAGWKAENGELSKIVIVDTDTGEVKETGYGGALLCVSPQRIIVRNYPTPFVGYVTPGDPGLMYFSRDLVRLAYLPVDAGRFPDFRGVPGPAI